MDQNGNTDLLWTQLRDIKVDMGMMEWDIDIDTDITDLLSKGSCSLLSPLN